MFEIVKKEVKNHKLIYFMLLISLAFAAYGRFYRTGTVLHFFYDQGRDAKVIWDFLQNGNFFLIGPTTGIAGIFRGPFYYYLIAPFYWLGWGNPVWPANFLAFTTILAIGLLYYLGLKTKDRLTGLFAAILASFSYYIMYASRWLSNPTPMFLLSLLFLWQFYLIQEGKRWAWISLAFISGLSLFHFGSSGEFFYFPAIGLFLLWQRDNFPKFSHILLSGLAFLFTASPLILFDIRHDFLLFGNIKAFIFEKGSFKSSFQNVLNTRLNFYDSVFFGKIFPGMNRWSQALKFFISIMFIFYIPKFLKNEKFKIILLLLLSPIIGLLFFQGNEGNVYGYYLTGYYLIFILGFAVVLRQIWESFVGKGIVLFFFYVFLAMNISLVNAHVKDLVDGPTTIAFKPQKQAIEWIYKDAADSEFNIDVYVPPVIPHAYDYLFTWYEDSLGYDGLIDEHVELLYTLYEEDPPHPERLEAWLERQEGIGEIVYEQKFSGIVVQKRKRIQ